MVASPTHGPWRGNVLGQDMAKAQTTPVVRGAIKALKQNIVAASRVPSSNAPGMASAENVTGDIKSSHHKADPVTIPDEYTPRSFWNIE